MSTLRWSEFGGFTVDENEAFSVDYDDFAHGFTLMHDLGQGGAHSVGHVGKYPTLAAAEEAAVQHVLRAAGSTRPCVTLTSEY